MRYPKAKASFRLLGHLGHMCRGPGPLKHVNRTHVPQCHSDSARRRRSYEMVSLADEPGEDREQYEIKYSCIHCMSRGKVTGTIYPHSAKLLACTLLRLVLPTCTHLMDPRRSCPWRYPPLSRPSDRRIAHPRHISGRSRGETTT